MITPIWLSIQNACEIAKFAGIQGPYSVRLTTANAEALIEELKSIGKPAEIVWRVGEQLLSMRAAGIEVVVDDDGMLAPLPKDKADAERAVARGQAWHRIEVAWQTGDTLDAIKKKLSIHDLRTLIGVIIP